MATQLIALADVNGVDGQYICSMALSGFCPQPKALPLDLTGWFAKPKPANAVAPPPSGKTIQVLHISDFHLDPRFKTGSEANCTSGLCCQTISNNTASIGHILTPAPRYGSFLCDTPMDLAGVATQAIPAIVGTDVAFTIFTGDLTSHHQDKYVVRIVSPRLSTDETFQSTFGTICRIRDGYYLHFHQGVVCA